MHEILKRNKELWNLFTMKDGYFQEEQLDKHIRSTSDISNHKNIFEPKVSKFLIDNGLEIEYPENKKFSVCLTHDVDEIYPPLSHTFLSSLYCIKNLNFTELKNQVFWKNRGKEFSPYRNFKEIMNLEEKYNAKSSFYFIVTDRDIRRFRYNIEDLQNELGYIVDNGWEVGLHGGYYAYNSLDNIINEKKKLEKVLGKKVIGYRNHYLRFKIPDTWKLLKEAGFKYDTTFGYNKGVGFRNGMCHPFHPFDLVNNQEIDITEIPLNIMDSALYNYNIKDAWDNIKKIIDIGEKYNGVVTILWHNAAFNCTFRRDWFMLYKKILNYCYEKNAWLTSGNEILDWWSKTQ
ncbi:MAG: polysaccharide deacetylase family protein [Candidatus Methanoperedens sp.]|nr:polysaccharide deacetylase family protein [Candidatus Methanoperedens sp.]CAG0951522.1 hypothetical protein METP1_00217 [Methanosarcinales archaeon]